MAFCNCRRNIIRFLSLRIHRCIFFGLLAMVVADTNRTTTKMDPQVERADSLNDPHIPISKGAQIQRPASAVPKHRSKRRGDTKEPLPASIRAKAIHYFRYSHHNSTIRVSKTFSLRCSNVLTELIYEKFPMADLFWELNSQPLRVDPSRMLYRPLGNELTILEADPKDSGVYTCKMAQNWYWTQTVEFFVVYVKSSKPTIKPRQPTAITLSCYSEPIYDLIPEVNRIWYHNGQMVCSGTGTDGEKLILHHTKSTDDGVWECMVSDSRITWLTSQVNVSVLPPLSRLELVMSQPKLLIGSIVLASAVSVVFFLVCLGFAYWGDRRDYNERLFFVEQLEHSAKGEGNEKTQMLF